MRLYLTSEGLLVEDSGTWRRVRGGIDELLVEHDLRSAVERRVDAAVDLSTSGLPPLLAPLQSQEVWAAGVTYFRSKQARVDESTASGGADCYRKVYDAARPE